VSRGGRACLFPACADDVFRSPVTVCTPSLLDGTILPGVTRDSVVTLLRDYASGAVALDGLPEHASVEVQERRILMREVSDAASRGELLEVFGSGTAACICREYHQRCGVE
jgi:branched-chain amino acid aminotransferase